MEIYNNQFISVEGGQSVFGVAIYTSSKRREKRAEKISVS